MRPQIEINPPTAPELTHHDLVSAVGQVAHRAAHIAAKGVQLAVGQDDGAGAAGVVDGVVLELLLVRTSMGPMRMYG